ncbi:putative phosphatidylinositol 3-kinase [Helianthus anomalus]
MTGNEFRFFLSCDINLPLTFRIEKLEGHLSSTNTSSPGRLIPLQIHYFNFNFNFIMKP